ncbi:MAG: 3'-5' exonuclease [Akkermansiaceae bacterium]|jgi:DNA polymerase III subunit epsilon|nr:3'-5' exonuclease [Akkermansiaceae bacterium]MDG1852569.1 3'-5' exonuclease [Verrucomicrobiales bacterium]
MDFGNIEFTAIDFESTGFGEDGTDEPIQIGMASMRGMKIQKKSLFRSFISPKKERNIENSANQVHRITDLDLKNAPKLNDLWSKINNSLSGKVVVAHGAGTEKRFLRNFPMHGFEPWIDTLQLARKLMPDAKNHSLNGLVKEIGKEHEISKYCPNLNWHDALFDSVASLVLLKSLLKNVSKKGIYQEIIQF